jgi:hypothetical protein
MAPRKTLGKKTKTISLVSKEDMSSKSKEGWSFILSFSWEVSITPQCYACIIALALHKHKHHSSCMGNIPETSIWNYWNIVMKHTGATYETHLWNIWNIHMKHGNTYMGLTHVKQVKHTIETYETLIWNICSMSCYFMFHCMYTLWSCVFNASVDVWVTKAP